MIIDLRVTSRRGDGVEALTSQRWRGGSRVAAGAHQRSGGSCLAASCPRPAAGAKSIAEERDTGQERRARWLGQLFGRRAAR